MSDILCIRPNKKFLDFYKSICRISLDLLGNFMTKHIRLAVFYILLLVQHVSFACTGAEDDKTCKEVYDFMTEVLKNNDMKARDKNGRTILHHIAYSGVPETIPQFIERGADVNAKDPDGNTPLHVASDVGDIETIRVFIKHGADVNARNNLGVTPEITK